MTWLAPAEAATALLRDANARARAFYLVGALPFTLGLIWFAADMLQNPYAKDHLPGASLALALLFLWKQAWQGAFMAELRDTLAGEATPWTVARAATLVLRQAAWQPLALLAIPFGFIAIVPSVWIFGYFRHLALDAATGARTGTRNLATLSSRGGWTPFFTAAVFAVAFLLLAVNLLAVVLVGPQLLLSFLGIRTTFSSLGASAVNGVAFTVALALAWLLIDPFIDAWFTLRAFREESRSSGLDLRAALRRALPLLLLAVNLPALDQDRFNRTADDVLRQDEFAWRARAARAPDGPLESFFRQAANYLERKIEDFAEWVRRTFFPRDRPEPGGNARASRGTVNALLLGLTGLVLVLVLALVWRHWQKPAAAAVAEATGTRIDLTDENLGAEALEEEAWLSLADGLIAQGDHRLAIRALHLAGLRWLAGRNFVSLHRGKTGAEYARELERRARSTPALATGFRGNLRAFEMIWYGRHAADAELAVRHRDAWKEMRAHAS